MFILYSVFCPVRFIDVWLMMEVEFHRKNVEFFNCRSERFIVNVWLRFEEMLLFEGVIRVIFGENMSREIMASKIFILE